MPKKINIDIKEDFDFLKKSLTNSASSLKQDRLKTLLFIKKGNYCFYSDIAKKLGRTEKTIRGWIQEYSKDGISTMLTVRIGTYKHSYLYNWLWGSFLPITGESFCMTTQSVCEKLFVKYLEYFSNHKPTELKIMIIDNAAFHYTKDVKIPDNIILFPIPPYCPELNLLR